MFLVANMVNNDMKRRTSDAVRVMPYRPDVHSAGAFSLWERTLGDRWPISLQVFREITEAVFSRVQTHNLVATDSAGNVLGYLATQVRPRQDTEASILLLTVDPDCRRQGIGTRLLNAAVDRFRSEEIGTVHLGANAELPFWQGIPTHLRSAKSFFEKHGWEIYEKSYDLIMDLRELLVPDWVMLRAQEQGVTVRPAQAEDVPAILSFHAQEFSYRWFAKAIDEGRIGDIVVALRGPDVVGSLIICDVGWTEWTGRQWREFLGQDMGAIGAVGVKESERGKGIGLALVAEGSRLLKERGVRNCFIHWTWLVDWYGKLGYKVWQEYWMARKPLCDS